MSNGPYPLIEQACAEVAAYLAEERVDVKILSRAERSRRERLLAAKDERAKAAARAAYAAELLPAVLGGEWTFSRRFGYSPEYLFKWDTEIDLRSVFDHALVYRRRTGEGR